MQDWRQKCALLVQYSLRYIVNFCWLVNITLPAPYAWSNDLMLKMMVMMMIKKKKKKKKKNAYEIKWLWRTLRHFRLLLSRKFGEYKRT
jgi:hypothetical protein